MLSQIYHQSLDTIKQWLEHIHPTELKPVPVRLHTDHLEPLRSKRIRQHQMPRQRHKY